MTENAKEYLAKIQPGAQPPLGLTDPEFVDRFASFAFDEVIHMPLVEGQEPIDDRTRFMAILATLLGCQGLDEFKIMLPAALNVGVSPAEAKEIIYQAVDYLGIGRVMPFLTAANEVYKHRGVALPLEPAATTTMEDRLEKGNAAQIEIFGEGIRASWTKGPEERRPISKWLADNCFGDYYTRKGLTLKEREMVTFCYLAAQGGCEPQLIAHAKGNMNMGNDRLFLYQIVCQCLPYIGYPRSLNALTCIDKAAENA
ncbi:MAG: carboxymuconolactone decarboxylase family protein [Firmicutes bacterium]|nr:carboxymuconolactone decarboxylase family protein [Bacillota bacterium]